MPEKRIFWTPVQRWGRGPTVQDLIRARVAQSTDPVTVPHQVLWEYSQAGEVPLGVGQRFKKSSKVCRSILGVTMDTI